MKWSTGLRVAAAVCAGVAWAATAPSAMARSDRPNVLVLFGDDVGYFNLSACNQGIMGCQTPSIDRIGNDGAVFTDAYAQQSCRAGRAAFMTVHSPTLTGLTKVDLPGAPNYSAADCR
jgi:arylsulfatase A-like enzyme